MGRKKKIVKENEVLIKELNELMVREDIRKLDDKPFPYLGWFWRPISDWEANGLPMSFLDGIWYLDEAGKWDYPKKRLVAVEANKLLKIWIKILKLRLEMLDYIMGKGRCVLSNF